MCIPNYLGNVFICKNIIILKIIKFLKKNNEISWIYSTDK